MSPTYDFRMVLGHVLMTLAHGNRPEPFIHTFKHQWPWTQATAPATPGTSVSYKYWSSVTIYDLHLFMSET